MIRFVDGDVLDADGGGVRHQRDHAVDHQERITVRDHLHDPLDLDAQSFLLGELCIHFLFALPLREPS
jgi:hypothetical protein